MKIDIAEQFVYLDTSALVKLISPEPQSTALKLAVDDSTMLIGEISVTELRRYAWRVSDNPTQLFDEIDHLVSSSMTLFMDYLVLEVAGEIALRHLGTLDAIHVATALRAHELDAFITYDKQQAVAARELGFNVISPE